MGEMRSVSTLAIPELSAGNSELTQVRSRFFCSFIKPTSIFFHRLCRDCKIVGLLGHKNARHVEVVSCL